MSAALDDYFIAVRHDDLVAGVLRLNVERRERLEVAQQDTGGAGRLGNEALERRDGFKA